MYTLLKNKIERNQEELVKELGEENREKVVNFFLPVQNLILKTDKTDLDRQGLKMLLNTLDITPDIFKEIVKL